MHKLIVFLFSEVQENNESDKNYDIKMMLKLISSLIISVSWLNRLKSCHDLMSITDSEVAANIRIIDVILWLCYYDVNNFLIMSLQLLIANLIKECQNKHHLSWKCFCFQFSLSFNFTMSLMLLMLMLYSIFTFYKYVNNNCIHDVFNSDIEK